MNDPLDQFIQSKKENSPYISLVDKEIVRGKLMSYKLVTKAGFNGEEKEVVRYEIEVATSDGFKVKKNFDNSTSKFAVQIKSNGAKPGMYLTITRVGTGPKTLYMVSDVSATATPSVSAGQAALPSVTPPDFEPEEKPRIIRVKTTG